MIDRNHDESWKSGEDLVERLLDRLERVRARASGWTASCPAHEDRTPSLSVSAGEDGRVLIHCHAGCSIEDVLAALGFTAADLFVQSGAENDVRPEAVYPYCDGRGTLLYEVVRQPGKRFRLRRPTPEGGYLWNMRGVERVLYRLPELLAAVGKQTVYLVEGEKDADAITARGGVATTNVGGAGKWKSAYAEVLRGADVVIVADLDEPGHRHAEQVRKSLSGVAASVRVVVPKEGKDAFDHLAAGHALDEFQLPAVSDRDLVELGALSVDAILASRPGLSKDELLAENPGLKALLGSKDSFAGELVKLVKETDVVLFHDEQLRAFARYPRDGHRETWPLRSKKFKHYLRWLCHTRLERTPNGQVISDALAMLEATALFEGEQLPVYLRVANASDAIYIDLGDDEWRAIRVTKAGWEIVNEYPVCFRRAAGMGSLPLPTRGGSLEQLRELVNLGSDDDYRLLVGWLLAALRPPGQPYPILILHGEQGSAKSTTARILRALIDPSAVPLRAAPRDLRDLMVSANASWTLSLDNLSRVEPWLSDALCRIATGGGFATRELYSDDDEVIFDAQRPVIINGIEEIATRSDLLDRALLLHLPAIPAEKRRNERGLWAAIRQAQPSLLGALLDGLVSVLANIETVQVERLPRMADFALWVAAAEPGLGWQPGSFLATYDQNRGQMHELAVEASPAGQVLVELARQGFHGTAGELLQAINDRVDEKLTRQRGWPASARAMSGLVRRIAPNLRELGYRVEFAREAGIARRRLIEIRPHANETVPTDPTVQNGLPRSVSEDDRNERQDATSPDSPVTETPWESILGEEDD